jgi:NADH-quinone oxidoreductase subunit J
MRSAIVFLLALLVLVPAGGLLAPGRASAQEAAPAPGTVRLPAGAHIRVLPGDQGNDGDDATLTPEQPAPTGKATAVAFWLFAALAIGGAVLTITRRNAVSAVMFLVGTFFAIAAVYVMLFAHFMAAIQVLVYAGAIMVLFVFVIMILNKEEEEPWATRGIFLKALAGGALLYFLVRMIQLLWTLRSPSSALGPEKAWIAGQFAQFGTTKAVGKELFTSYLFPFEAISVALLIAIVGAVVLAHPDHPTAQGGEAGPAGGGSSHG